MWLFSFRVTLINILRHPWGLYVEYYAGRGPGPQRGNRGIWSRLGHPEVLRFWQHKVEAKASALHTFRWMAVDESRPFLHVSFTGHFLFVYKYILMKNSSTAVTSTQLYKDFWHMLTSLCPLDLHPDLFCTVDQGSHDHPAHLAWPPTSLPEVSASDKLSQEVIDTNQKKSDSTWLNTFSETYTRSDIIWWHFVSTIHWSPT